MEEEEVRAAADSRRAVCAVRAGPAGISVGKKTQDSWSLGPFWTFCFKDLQGKTDFNQFLLHRIFLALILDHIHDHF